jgi:hypothetical protein
MVSIKTLTLEEKDKIKHLHFELGLSMRKISIGLNIPLKLIKICCNGNHKKEN